MSWKMWAMSLIISALLGYLLNGALLAVKGMSAEYQRYEYQPELR
jgi:hypothetical protein